VTPDIIQADFRFHGPRRVFRCDTPSIFFVLFILILNSAAIIMGSLYVVASLVPTSTLSFALEFNSASYDVYLFFTVVVSVLASFVDFLVLSSSSGTIRRSGLLKLFLAVALLTLSWWPYAVETSLAKWAWENGCKEFDATILLNGKYSNPMDLSTAHFPETFENTTMQLSLLQDKAYAFSTVSPGATVSYNFQNRTYTFISTTAFPCSRNRTNRILNSTRVTGMFSDKPLTFPEIGLYSNGSWTKRSFPPAVRLTTRMGGIGLRTGPSMFGDGCQLKVCVNLRIGICEIVIIVGRILIALAESCRS
jgi:hypothetical protein